MELIDPDTARWMYEIDPGVMLVPDRDHFEYVYRTSDLAELPGKHYIKIRNQIKKFRKTAGTLSSLSHPETGRS